MNNPLVSVCIPTYNNAHYIGKTLESIINQTYKNIEIIISDNASSDNTEEIIRAFGDQRIKYYKNPETVVCLANWNLSIKLSQGDYVSIYHSDDIYEPNIVEEELKFLQIFPEVGAVFCLDKIIDENDRFIRNGVNLPQKFEKKNIINFVDLFLALLEKSGSFLVAPTFMAKKEIFTKVGFFKETTEFGDSTGSAADTEMWLRITQKYKIGIIKERLINRRISNTQGSYQYENNRVLRANHFLVLDSFLKNSDIKGKIDRKILGQYEFNKFWDDVIIAKNLVKQKRNKDAKNLLLSSLSWNKVSTGFKNVKNFIKLVIYLFLLILTFFGIAKIGIKILQFIQEKIWLNQKI